MRSQGHWTIANQGFDSLNRDHEGWADEHDEDEEAEHFVLVHHPEEDREELEEGEGVDELIPKDAGKRSNRYFQDIIIIEFLLFPLLKSLTNNTTNNNSLNSRFQSRKDLFLLMIVKLSLLEHKDKQNLTTF